MTEGATTHAEVTAPAGAQTPAAASGLTRAQRRAIRACVPFPFRETEAGWEWRSEEGMMVAVYAGDEKNTLAVSVIDLEAGHAVELWTNILRLTGLWRRRVRQFSGEAMILAQSRPSCPKCGKPMRLRRSREEQNQFYGCSQFPKCRGLLNIIDWDVKHV